MIFITLPVRHGCKAIKKIYSKYKTNGNYKMNIKTEIEGLAKIKAAPKYRLSPKWQAIELLKVKKNLVVANIFY